MYLKLALVALVTILLPSDDNNWVLNENFNYYQDENKDLKGENFKVVHNYW